MIPMFSLCFGDGIQGKAGARAAEQGRGGILKENPRDWGQDPAGKSHRKSQRFGSGSSWKVAGIKVGIPNENSRDWDPAGKPQGFGSGICWIPTENPRDWGRDPAGKPQGICVGILLDPNGKPQGLGSGS